MVAPPATEQNRILNARPRTKVASAEIAVLGKEALGVALLVSGETTNRAVVQSGGWARRFTSQA
jgi:hypothetical protein